MKSFYEYFAVTMKGWWVMLWYGLLAVLCLLDDSWVGFLGLTFCFVVFVAACWIKSRPVT